MTSRTVISVTKYVNEVLDQSINFTNVLEAGESVSSGSVTAITVT